MLARLRAFFRTRTGRLVLHDGTIALGAGYAAWDAGGHSLTWGAAVAALLVAGKAFLRLILPVPAGRVGALTVRSAVRRAAAGTAAIATGRGRGHRLHIGIVLQVDKANVSAADVKSWLKPLSTQLGDFCRAWGLLKPSVTLYTSPPASIDGLHLVIVILDNSDQADALGYHDETTGGVPYARVFALDCQNAGVSVSSCVSHELLEAVADLACDRWAQAPDGTLWAIEVCDPVESDTYDIGDVEVSNYVLPAYFDGNGRAPYDALERITAPFTLSKAGYAIVQSGGKVRQVFGDRAAYRKTQGWRIATKSSPLSRTARRLAK